METIMENQVITKTCLFSTREEYLNFKAAWAKLAKEKKISSSMILFYNIVRGKEVSRGFTDIRNPNKLANGARPDLAFVNALNDFSGMYHCLYQYKFVGWPPKFERTIWNGDKLVEFIKQFNGTVTLELMSKIKESVK
jgi:hypothetical protein